MSIYRYETKASKQDEVLDHLTAWAEHITLAVSGCAGLSVTSAKQATAHLLEARKLLGRVSPQEPDDRLSKWPEGEKR